MGKYDTQRKQAYAEGELPYSFTYKIVKKFIGKRCPVCNRQMGVSVYSEPIWAKTPKPTVQHNIPICRGGKHNIDNISVICLKCNTSIRGNETEKLNNEEVKKAWEEILNGI